MAFPSWRYGPDGQADVFACAEDVPPGWQDHPSKVGDKLTYAELAAEVAKMDPDGDGRIGGPVKRKPKKVKRNGHGK